MCKLGTRETARERLAGNAKFNGMTEHEYLDALEEALIALRVFGKEEEWRKVGRKTLLRRLLDARMMVEKGDYDWGEYKKALGLTGET